MARGSFPERNRGILMLSWLASMRSAIVDDIRAKQARGGARLARKAEEKAAAGEQKRSEQAEVMAVVDGAELAEIIDIKALGKRKR